MAGRSGNKQNYTPILVLSFVEGIRPELTESGNYQLLVKVKVTEQNGKIRSGEKIQFHLNNDEAHTVAGTSDRYGIAMATIRDIPYKEFTQTIKAISGQAESELSFKTPLPAEEKRTKGRTYQLRIDRASTVPVPEQDKRDVTVSILLESDSQPVANRKVRFWVLGHEITAERPDEASSETPQNFMTDATGHVKIRFDVEGLDKRSVAVRAIAIDDDGKELCESTENFKFEKFSKPMPAHITVTADPIDNEPGKYRVLVKVVDSKGQPCKGVPVYINGGKGVEKTETDGTKMENEPYQATTNEYGFADIVVECSDNMYYTQFGLQISGGKLPTKHLRLAGKQAGAQYLKPPDLAEASLSEVIKACFQYGSKRRTRQPKGVWS